MRKINSVKVYGAGSKLYDKTSKHAETFQSNQWMDYDTFLEWVKYSSRALFLPSFKFFTNTFTSWNWNLLNLWTFYIEVFE